MTAHTFKYHLALAAYYIDQALIRVEIAREASRDSRIAIDHIVDERKLRHMADRLRMLTEEAVS